MTPVFFCFIELDVKPKEHHVSIRDDVFLSFRSDDAFLAGTFPAVVGNEIIVITWLHKAQRDVLKVHPRDDESKPLAGVFATRSPDRPNPLGLHRVKIFEIDGARLKVGPIEAIDGTPVVDIKPTLPQSTDS